MFLHIVIILQPLSAHPLSLFFSSFFLIQIKSLKTEGIIWLYSFLNILGQMYDLGLYKYNLPDFYFFLSQLLLYCIVRSYSAGLVHADYRGFIYIVLWVLGSQSWAQPGSVLYLFVSLFHLVFLNCVFFFLSFVFYCEALWDICSRKVQK